MYCNNDAVVVLPLPASISLDAHDVFVIAIYGIRLLSCGRRALDVGWLDYRPPFVIGHRLMSHNGRWLLVFSCYHHRGSCHSSSTSDVPPRTASWGLLFDNEATSPRSSPDNNANHC